MRKGSIVVALALGLMLAPVVVHASSSGTYATYNCKATKKRPTYIVFACADGSFYAKRLTWSTWGTKHAQGRGVFHFNDCNPSCAGGTFHTRKGLIALRTRMWCPKIKRYVFSRGTATYDKPWNGQRTSKLFLSCPF